MMAHTPGLPRSAPAPGLRPKSADAFRSAGATAVAAWGGRLVAAAAQLINLRLVTDVLGQDGYAAFALVACLQGWYLLADLGIGTSVQNHVSERLATGTDPEPIVRSGVQLLAATIAVGTLLTMAAGPAASEWYLARITSIPAVDRLAAMVIGGVLFLGGTTGQVAQQLWYARRRGWVAAVVLAVAQTGSVFLLVAVRAHGPGHTLPVAVAAAFGPQAIAGVALLATAARGSLRRIREIDRDALRAVWRRSCVVGPFALAAAVVLQADALVLSQLISEGDIAAYAVVTRMFAFPLLLFTAGLNAVWPAFTERFAAGALSELRQAFRRMLRAGVLAMTLIVTVLGLQVDRIVAILAPSASIRAPAALVWILAGYQVLRVWTDAHGMVLMSQTRLRPFWLLTPAQAVLAVVLEVALARRFGVAGIAAGLMLSFVLTVAWGLPWAVRRSLARASLGVGNGNAPPEGAT